MSLEITAFGETRLAIGACINFSKLPDIFDKKGMIIINFDCQYVLQFVRGILSEVP